MVSGLLGIRPADRRAAWVGAGTLLIVIAAHTLMETARDALFLRDLPATHLPWAYLAIAIVACGVGMIGGRAGAGPASRGMLQLALLVGALATVVFWTLTARPSPAILISLYVWTGVFASVIVMLIWLFLGEHVDVAQAKRIYGLIAAGGLAGAALGGVMATLILTVGPPRVLLPACGLLLLVAAGITRAAGGRRPVPPEEEPSPEGATPALGLVARDPYVRGIVTTTLVAALIFTTVDFVYKSLVRREVAADDLGHFFARYNTFVYGTALLVHVVLASRILRSLGVIRALAVLPSVLLVGAGGVALGGGLLAVLAVKGADVSLRHSLHRASTEILFLPIPAAQRATVKAWADGLGQRGGQALASLLLLGAARRGVGLPALGAMLAAASGVWLLLVTRLRRHYVDRFRTRLADVRGDEQVRVPGLDLYSLEALVAALGSPHDAEVIAALDILEEYGKTALVSPFILYHPSRAVVLRAIEVFASAPREDARTVQRRLVTHGDPEIRAATLRSLGPAALERDLLWSIVQQDGAPEVRATALVVLLCERGEVGTEEGQATAREVLGVWPKPARAALAQTLRRLPRSIGRPLARALLAEADEEVRHEMALALAETPDRELLDVYTALIAHRESREPARESLFAVGDAALEHLGRVLGDPETPPAVRLHLPRSISRFQSERAVALLVAALVEEEAPRVRYKILRGLGRMRANDPALPVDREPLLAEAREALARGVTSLLYLVTYELLLAAHPDRRSQSDLLGSLLREKERRALERVFRILHILEPNEEYRRMYHALASRDAGMQATSRELLEHVVPDAELRAGILAMTDRQPAIQRLTRTLAFVSPAANERLIEIAATVAEGGAMRAEPNAVAGPLLEAMRADHDPVLAALAEHALGSGEAPWAA